MRMDTLYEPDFEPWREGAICTRRPEVDFFPVPGDAPGVARAKAVCSGCPVVDDCLYFALETGQIDGIWGGMTPPERSRLRRSWLRDLRQAS
jgi:WhiB family redox-sensing transcriptional regulator